MGKLVDVGVAAGLPVSVDSVGSSEVCELGALVPATFVGAGERDRDCPNDTDCVGKLVDVVVAGLPASVDNVGSSEACELAACVPTTVVGAGERENDCPRDINGVGKLVDAAPGGLVITVPTDGVDRAVGKADLKT